MKKQATKLLIVMFIFSMLYLFTIKFPNNATSFDMGFAAGTIFGQAIKLIGMLSLVLFGIQRLYKQRLFR